MAINIKDPETDALVRRLSVLTGTSITDTIKDAVQEQLSRLEGASRRRSKAAGLQHFIERGRRRATLDHRSEDEILGYDEQGLPS